MRKPSKITGKPIRSAAKKMASSRNGGDAAASVLKAEPAYININEHEAEIAAKSRVLWLMVAVFTVFLVIFWLFVLRINIQKESDGIGFSQIGSQISESLARFDTEIKNRSAAKAISADDLAAIKDGLEERIKSNPDSSLWPTHELPSLKISIQYPDRWIKSGSETEAILTDSGQASSSADSSGSGRIRISAQSNPKRYDIMAWLQKNPMDGYTAQRRLFFSSSSIDNLIFNSSSTGAGYLDKVILLNSASGRMIWKISISARGDIRYYEPLTEEIVRTIKIIK